MINDNNQILYYSIDNYSFEWNNSWLGNIELKAILKRNILIINDNIKIV